MLAPIAVASSEASAAATASALARQLDLPLALPDDTRYPLLLACTPDRLELRENGTPRPGPVYVDFVLGRAAFRRARGGGRQQAIARAVGLKSGAMPRIVDATAGFGQDAFVLAGLGCSVHMLERSPVIAALLEDGLRRAGADPQIAEWVRERLTMTAADARIWLAELGVKQRPDAIYLDPMYPHRRRQAQPKKGARALRLLAGVDVDSSELLEVALATASSRVVVKRPRQAPPIGGLVPSHQINSANTRFDVYLA